MKNNEYEVTLVNSREGKDHYDYIYTVSAATVQKAISNAFSQLKKQLGHYPVIEDVRCIEL